MIRLSGHPPTRGGPGADLGMGDQTAHRASARIWQRFTSHREPTNRFHHTRKFGGGPVGRRTDRICAASPQCFRPVARTSEISGRFVLDRFLLFFVNGTHGRWRHDRTLHRFLRQVSRSVDDAIPASIGTPRSRIPVFGHGDGTQSSCQHVPASADGPRKNAVDHRPW